MIESRSAIAGMRGASDSIDLLVADVVVRSRFMLELRLFDESAGPAGPFNTLLLVSLIRLVDSVSIRMSIVDD